MKAAPIDKHLTVGEFVAIVERLNGRHELIDGRVVARPPCTVRHANANGSLLAALRRTLADTPDGSRARALGSQMGLRLAGGNVRYPMARFTTIHATRARRRPIVLLCSTRG